MSSVLLYTKAGTTSIFLGEVEAGDDGYNQPTTVWAMNTGIHQLRNINIRTEGEAATYVQLSQRDGEWVDKIDVEILEPADEFAFMARVKSPPVDDGSGPRKFEFVVKSEEVG